MRKEIQEDMEITHNGSSERIMKMPYLFVKEKREERNEDQRQGREKMLEKHERWERTRYLYVSLQELKIEKTKDPIEPCEWNFF